MAWSWFYISSFNKVTRFVQDNPTFKALIPPLPKTGCGTAFCPTFPEQVRKLLQLHLYPRLTASCSLVWHLSNILPIFVRITKCSEERSTLASITDTRNGRPNNARSSPPTVAPVPLWGERHFTLLGLGDLQDSHNTSQCQQCAQSSVLFSS